MAESISVVLWVKDRWPVVCPAFLWHEIILDTLGLKIEQLDYFPAFEGHEITSDMLDYGLIACVFPAF